VIVTYAAHRGTLRVHFAHVGLQFGVPLLKSSLWLYIYYYLFIYLLYLVALGTALYSLLIYLVDSILFNLTGLCQYTFCVCWYPLQRRTGSDTLTHTYRDFSHPLPRASPSLTRALCGRARRDLSLPLSSTGAARPPMPYTAPGPCVACHLLPRHVSTRWHLPHRAGPWLLFGDCAF